MRNAPSLNDIDYSAYEPVPFQTFQELLKTIKKFPQRFQNNKIDLAFLNEVKPVYFLSLVRIYIPNFILKSLLLDHRT